MKEILESKQGLESHLECKINHFSYPFGVRMDKSLEEKFILNHSNSIKSMAGIKFKFKESKDTYQLERDKMEEDLSAVIRVLRTRAQSQVRSVIHTPSSLVFIFSSLSFFWVKKRNKKQQIGSVDTVAFTNQ